MGRLTVPNADPNLLSSGEENVSRLLAPVSTIPLSTQVLRLSYFTARKSEAIGNVRVLTGGTAAAATPSLVRFGIYSVAADGALTLVASTANDTSLLAAQSTAYTKALSASFAKVAGQRYAVGMLVVTATTAPTVNGLFVGSASTEAGLAPRLAAAVVGQSDLPASIAAGSLADSINYCYTALAP